MTQHKYSNESIESNSSPIKFDPDSALLKDIDFLLDFDKDSVHSDAEEDHPRR